MCGCVASVQTRDPDLVLRAISELGPGMTQDEVYKSLARHRVYVGPMFGAINGRIEKVVWCLEHWDVHLYFDPNLKRIDIRRNDGVPRLPSEDSIFRRAWESETVIGEGPEVLPRWPELDKTK
jgi:hypothetical protein